MRRTSVLHIIDNDVRQRARLSHLAFSAGFRPEIYDSIDEVDVARLGDSVILLHDALPLDASVPTGGSVHRCSGLSPTIVFSTSADPARIVNAILAGALDYFVLPTDQDLSSAPLVACIERVQGRATDRSSHAMREVVARRRVACLSAREAEILEGIVDGHSNKHIARLLNISHRTVEKHRANVFVKMGVRNSAEAIHIGNYACAEVGLPPVATLRARAG